MTNYKKQQSDFEELKKEIYNNPRYRIWDWYGTKMNRGDVIRFAFSDARKQLDIEPQEVVHIGFANIDYPLNAMWFTEVICRVSDPWYGWGCQNRDLAFKF